MFSSNYGHISCWALLDILKLFFSYSFDCGTVQSITDSSSFHVDNYVLPIINAVYTFVAAAHETLKEQCGETYDGVCSKFYSDPETNSILYSKLTEVGFQDESETTFNFIGKEGSTGREIVLFDGSQMTKVCRKFILCLHVCLSACVCMDVSALCVCVHEHACLSAFLAQQSKKVVWRNRGSGCSGRQLDCL